MGLSRTEYNKRVPSKRKNKLTKDEMIKLNELRLKMSMRPQGFKKTPQTSNLYQVTQRKK